MCKHCIKIDVKGLSLEEKNAASRDLKKKLKLENKLAGDLNKLMRRMNKEFRKKYAAQGVILDFSRYSASMGSILEKHYARVQKEFKGTVKAPTKQVSDDEFIALGFAEWQAQRLETQPDILLETTQKDADKAVRDAQSSLLEEGVAITAAAVAAAASVINMRRMAGRVTGISITETQSAAESAKLIEAQALSGRIPFSIQQDPFALTRPREEDILPAKKQWVTVGDRRVRSTHVSADKQVVSIDEPFMVGGYPMRHPGDLSLGAPVKEWINCRCSSNIKIGD